MLAGQLADGLATPLVGWLSDTFDFNYGKRTLWYVIGHIIVIPAFYLTFHSCIFCRWACPDIEDEAKYDKDCTAAAMGYYILFPSLFNVGKLDSRTRLGLSADL